MKHIHRFSNLRLALRVLPRLPFIVARSLLRTLPMDKPVTDVEVDGTDQEPAPAPPRKRALLRYVPRFPKTRRALASKAPEGEEVSQISDLIDHNIETIVSLHMHAELKVSRHQRFLERLTSLLGRPSAFYLVLVLIVAWVFFNVFDPYVHLPVFDPVPFAWLQGLIGLSAMLMTILVLITQNRQARFAERRKHLDLQINLVVEHKVSKLIALVEELRRDMPIVRDRYDQEAEAMSESVDPEAVFLALDETLAEMNPEEEQLIVQSELTVDVETSVTTRDTHSFPLSS
ncbi:MAG: DUF1003 domain-containing protein [Ktedonobacteraceae bacterium]|nr:DUF1003 domain-containing protein [Ktedonobacteraceae bacterium]